MPAFSGLFAPYWRSDARGVIVGLSRFHTKAHLARAALEAICYQSVDVVEAMEADAGVRLDVLKVDGGVTANDLCMQIQADTLGVDVSRPVVAETTALGAAYAAGLACGFWGSPDELRANWQEDRRWTPQTTRRAAGRGATPAGRRPYSARSTGSRCEGPTMTRTVTAERRGQMAQTPTGTWPWSWSGPPRRRRSTAPAIWGTATRTRWTRPRWTRCGRCWARSG